MQRRDTQQVGAKPSALQALVAVPFMLDEFEETGNFAIGGLGLLGFFDVCTSLAAFLLTPLANLYLEKESRDQTESSSHKRSKRHTSSGICNYIIAARKQPHLCKSNLSLRRKTRILKHFHKSHCPLPTA